MNEFILVLLCSGLTFLATILGAASVYIFKNINQIFEKICLGLASGIMISVSIFSLIIPALEINNYWIVILGIFLGSLLIYTLKIINKNIKKEDKSLFFLAVTLHNIPEGMIVGLSCALVFSNPNYSVISASALSLGIAIQNLPEGMATSLPLLRNGIGKNKAFIKGVISGVVEPISAIIMLLLSNLLSDLMPFFLSLAAGSMLYVVVDELIPEGKDSKSSIGAITFMIGFIIMMILDLSLG